MSAYIIADTKIKDAEAYEEYKKLARPIAENMAVSINREGAILKY